MDPALYKVAMQGNAQILRQLVIDDVKILNSKTPQDSTALHLAALHGHRDLADELLKNSEELLIAKNADGDTPLHLAARAGKLDVAQLLINLALAWPGDLPDTYLKAPLMMTNKAGDTPLHEAVKHSKCDVAIKLLEADHSRGHALNKKMQSPLHIAAREGLAVVVKKIVDHPWVDEQFVSSISVSGSPLHQAVLGGHIQVVEILLDKKAELTDLKDSLDNNALHYAAQKNNPRMVSMLLNVKPNLAYGKNKDQQSPLHVAASYGSTEAIRELMKQCSDVAEMVDSKGMTALHVAIVSGKVNALKCLLKYVLPEEIINRVDHDGNSPLHLAAKHTRIQSALLLLKDRRVNPCLLNKDDQTARSIIETTTEEMDTYELYLWKELKKQESIKCKKQQLPPVATYQSLRRRSSSHEYFELSVNTYTLVAALIATVTFAATFTMPGAYNQQGMAIHGHRAAFKIFVISNTVAMCSSIVVVFCFIWAWRDPVKFKLDQLIWGHRLTVVAGLAMVVSLMTAVFLTVVPGSRWPAYVVMAIGASTPVVVFLILGKEVLYVPL